MMAAVHNAYTCAALSLLRDLEGDLAPPRLEWDFLPRRELDLDEEREAGRLVRVAKSSGATREMDSIPMGP